MLAHVLSHCYLFTVILAAVDQYQEVLDRGEEASFNDGVADLTIFLAVQDWIAVGETLFHLVCSSHNSNLEYICNKYCDLISQSEVSISLQDFRDLKLHAA